MDSNGVILFQPVKVCVSLRVRVMRWFLCLFLKCISSQCRITILLIIHCSDISFLWVKSRIPHYLQHILKCPDFTAFPAIIQNNYVILLCNTKQTCGMEPTEGKDGSKSLVYCTQGLLRVWRSQSQHTHFYTCWFYTCWFRSLYCYIWGIWQIKL